VSFVGEEATTAKIRFYLSNPRPVVVMFRKLLLKKLLAQPHPQQQWDTDWTD